MSISRIQTLKNKAKLLQKAKAKAGKPILLKTALNLIAKTSGFANWRELNENLQENEILCSRLTSALWHNWYADYESALVTLKANQFLLPYQKHFFICDENYIKELGLSKTDPDLKKVGNNWIAPKDKNAWTRLLQKIRKNKN